MWSLQAQVLPSKLAEQFQLRPGDQEQTPCVLPHHVALEPRANLIDR